MKKLFTLLLVAFSLTAFAQTEPVKKDSVVAPAAGDTLKIDLLKYSAFDRLQSILHQKMEAQSQALALKEKLSGLEGQERSILDGELLHEPKFDPARKILANGVVGTFYFVVQEKKAAVETKKKKGN